MLAEAGGLAVEHPDHAFFAELEHTLVSSTPPGRLVALPNRPRKARRPGVLSGAAAAAAAVVLIGALTGVYGAGVDDQALALAVAVDTTVQLPDGTTVTGARGLALPDGAVVRTGPNGHCAAGAVELGPGLEAFVDAGRLRLRMSAPGDGIEAETPASAPDLGTAPTGVPTAVVPGATDRVPAGDAVVRVPAPGASSR